MRRFSIALGLLFALVFTPGFVCSSRVERVEGEVDALRLQFEEIQQRVNDDQAEVTEMLLRADADLERLDETIRKLENLMGGNLIDFQQELESQRNEVAQLRGDLDRQQRRLETTEQTVRAVVENVGVVVGSGVQLPTAPDELLKFADDAYAAANFVDAGVAYEEFFVVNDTDPRLDYVLHRLVLAKQQAGENQDAVARAKQFIRTYQDSKHLNATIWHMGLAAEAMNDCNTAKAAFESLRKTSSHGSDAKKALARLGSC